MSNVNRHNRRAPERPMPMRALVEALGARETSPHDGVGEVQLLRAYDRAEGGPLVELIHLVIVPPGSTLGRHRHGDDSEWYVILDGEGTMHVDGHDVPVRRGDVVVNRPFGEHGLTNDAANDLHVMVFKITPAEPER
jgi:mannose-6-phosphate isomerase-like protein (cupin superfamily)